MENYTSINGVDYIGLDYGALQNAFGRSHKFNCELDGCGSAFVRGGVVVITENLGMLIGWDCMDKIDNGLLRAHMSNIAQSENSNIQREQLSNNSEALHYYVNLYKKADVIEEFAIKVNHGLYHLKKVAGAGGFNQFLNELIAKFIKTGRLSPKQIEVFEKSYSRLQEFRADAIKQDSKEFKAVPNSRVIIKGSIKSIKPVSTKFGDVKKAIIITDDNIKFSCNLPSDIENEAMVNNNIQMCITLKASDNNEYFGFGSRPSKAKILN